MSLPEGTNISPEAYLAFERSIKHKSEYVNGQIIEMFGETLAHNTIASDTFFHLSLQLRERDRRCRVWIARMRLYIPATGSYRYPDLMVMCGEPELVDDYRDCVLNPRILIEIVTAESALQDHNQRLDEYQKVASVQEILLIQQDQPRIIHYRRGEKNWTSTDFVGMDNIIDLPSLNCTLAFSDVYQHITFEDDQL